MKRKGMLIIISGFSGAGKGTVVKKLVKNYNYSLSISATTRSPREGEQDGREYYFKSVEDFRKLIDYNGFIEWAQYVENYYGTPRAFVEKEMELGNDVILEIEVQGALNIKKQYPQALLIFIAAPSAKELKNRLIGRGTEDMDTVNKRLRRACEEATDMTNYEYIVINDDLSDCVRDVHSIVRSECCKMTNQQKFISEIQDNLSAL